MANDFGPQEATVIVCRREELAKEVNNLLHYEEDQQRRRELLNEFHTRPAEAQLVTIEDWALQKESSEAEVVMSAVVMDMWDMSTVAQVRGRRIRTGTSHFPQFPRWKVSLWNFGSYKQWVDMRCQVCRRCERTALRFS